MSSFYWFDYETFGTHPAWDRPAQFAGVRTDMNLNPLGEPLVIYCRPPGDYLPNPHACRVTGLLPAEVAEQGLSEADFINQVVAELGHPGTCSVGYNNIRFDDEFTRHTLFRNFHDPYEQEWKHGNSRWDLLDVVRLTRALRPAGIEWPSLPDGTPSNRLELLTAANKLEHANAHDALSDVWATIAMAGLLRDCQPRLFDYVFSHRDKQSVAAMLNVRQRQACIQISGMIPGRHGHAAIVVPIARHPVNQNGVIVLDLRSDPAELANLDAEGIAARVFTSSDTTGTATRLRLRTIHINRCPVLVPLATLGDADAHRLDIDIQQHQEHLERFEALYSEALAERVRQAMSRPWEARTIDVDGSLYGGSFFKQADKQRFADIRSDAPSELAGYAGQFDDTRLNEMLFRYRARNYPDTLSDAENLDWQQHIKARLTTKDAPWLTFDGFAEEMQSIEWGDDEAQLRASLQQFAADLKS